ncbi:hypothetical protein NE237_021128 [Protea cynaroides]|uniref:Uncharacterized protein n=1 Tax=Protea cynaroides TaxID=273540 RepID=A0A9Q0K4K8_9MAGN|nr:hypothetical protein NE237_021128 [Protea cynaroides]
MEAYRVACFTKMLNICCTGHSSLQPNVEQNLLQNKFSCGVRYDSNYPSFPPDHKRDNPHREFYEISEEVCALWDDGPKVAWRHLLTETNESETNNSYKQALTRVERQARAVYRNHNESGINDEFLQLMAEKGCFILQVALCSLGGPMPYPLAEKTNNIALIKGLVRLMFSIQNQIPIVVLKDLMKQRFFRNVLKNGKWKRPNDLGRMILYDVLIEPVLDFKKRSRWQQQPITLLHALWLRLTGSVISNGSVEDKGLLYTSLSPVRSAVELQSAGIIFKSEEGMGTTQIKFQKRMLEARLYLPCIYMDEDTIELFKSLIHFEAEVGLDMNRREVSAYLMFIQELVCSPLDVKLLVTQGIIDTDLGFEKNIHLWVKSLRTLEVGNDHNLGAVRRQIRRYVQPSIRPKILNLIVIGFVLTLVQTIYTALSYHHPFNS